MKLIKYLFLLICAVTICFISLEALIRIFVVEESVVIDNNTHRRGFYDSVVYQETYGKRLKSDVNVTIKNHHLTHKDVPFRTNKFGLRGADITLSDLESTYKVLFIGDSVTLENYLPEEETFIGILNDLYHEQGRDDILLLNGGIWDVGIQEEYYILKEKSELIKPDLVILDFYLNDSRPSWGFEREERLNFLKYLQKSRLISYIYNRLAVRDFLNKQGLIRENFRFGWIDLAKDGRWRDDPDEFMELVQEADLDWGAAWDGESWLIVEEYLSKMKGLSEEEGFRLAVVCFPVSFQVDAGFIMDHPQQELSRICQRLDIEFFDLLPCMRMYNNTRIFYDHCHLNLAGNEVSAECIKDFLEEIIEQL